MASSSARRVARVAARSGSGRQPNKQRNWLFPAAIALVVVLGLGIVVYARAVNEGAGDNDTPPRANLGAGSPSDHWHASFAIDICGEEQPPVADAEDDILGIHTHQDGLIHVHPFATRAAGDGATISRFFDQVGIEVTDDAIKLPDGKVYREGETKCGGEAGEVQLAVWDQAVKAPTSEPDQVLTSNLGDTRFERDYMAMTLAFVPKGGDILAPSSSAEIKTLGACDGDDPPPECGAGATPAAPPAEGGGSTTIPGEGSTPAPGDTTPTTAAGDATTTTAPAAGQTTTTRGG